MRLWTIHPKYLDAKGLVALWREGLLAQKVLQNRTAGYRSHPQLSRFRSSPSPLGALGRFLRGVYREAEKRGYHFNKTKINRQRFTGTLRENRGQLEYEWHHFLKKLQRRNPARYNEYRTLAHPESHPVFRVGPGGIQPWEKR